MLTSGVCLLPGLLKIVGDIKRHAWIKLFLSMLATGLLIGALVVLPVKVTDTLEDGKTLAWATPLGLVLTSSSSPHTQPATWLTILLAENAKRSEDCFWNLPFHTKKKGYTLNGSHWPTVCPVLTRLPPWELASTY